MVQLSTKAEIANNSLLPLDRLQVAQAFALLDRFPEDEWVRQQARVIRNEAEEFYLLKVGAAIRILFKPTDEGIEVLDIVADERLKRMHGYTLHVGS